MNANEINCSSYYLFLITRASARQLIAKANKINNLSYAIHWKILK